MRTARSTVVVCTRCAAEVPRPPDVQWRPLWDEGWRWIGSQNLFSCPACPPVILVDEQGRHRAPQQVAGS
ncbi:hypothetical protein [Streptomyces sp. H27-C3]|uniref:hypothetical protein n=1 Tax=Streptomyces sp. H27-C3 TaxID=3046305 RepID=UPI0024B8BF96|nr:hypothetical protein [Streptomyces sp. H27-C3]MDJ0464962.1 hypothetical protein [Streptomyces sp. H27-C3]